MKLFLNSNQFFDTDEPHDLSIPIVNGTKNLRAWHIDPPKMEAVRANGFIGSVAEGGDVNFRTIFFNPHGHGTHTECLGHITETIYSVNSILKNFFFKAQIVTIEPRQIQNEEYMEIDGVITLGQLKAIKWEPEIDALIIRTSPNLESKKHFDYSATNPPYMDIDCLLEINRLGIKHLLLDLPSVDRESDGGKLAFHHGFWGVPDKMNFERTITELIYIEDQIKDGAYVLELQMASFVNDAAPSRPVIYQIKSI